MLEPAGTVVDEAHRCYCCVEIPGCSRTGDICTPVPPPPRQFIQCLSVRCHLLAHPAAPTAANGTRADVGQSKQHRRDTCNPRSCRNRSCLRG